MSTVTVTPRQVLAELEQLTALLTSTAGATNVGVTDTNGYFTGSTVEAVVNELFTNTTLTVVADPGTAAAIPVTTSASIALVIAGAGETNTLAIPTFVGQQLSISVNTLAGGGARVITSAQAINQAGNILMDFSLARDYILLGAITVAGALRWQVLSNNGVTLGP